MELQEALGNGWYADTSSLQPHPPNLSTQGYSYLPDSFQSTMDYDSALQGMSACPIDTFFDFASFENLDTQVLRVPVLDSIGELQHSLQYCSGQQIPLWEVFTGKSQQYNYDEWTNPQDFQKADPNILYMPLSRSIYSDDLLTPDSVINYSVDSALLDQESIPATAGNRIANQNSHVSKELRNNGNRLEDGRTRARFYLRAGKCPMKDCRHERLHALQTETRQR